MTKPLQNTSHRAYKMSQILICCVRATFM